MRKRLRGFTLIEMLVVIAIIATLIGLLFPAISGMQERGKVVQEMNNLRQIGIATQTFLNDNDGAYFLPTENWIKRLHPDGGTQYLPSWKVFQSPFDRRSAAEGSNAPVSYGFNGNAVSGPGEGGGGPGPLLSDQITNTSVFVLFAPAQGSGPTPVFYGTAAGPVTIVKQTSSPGGTAAGGTHKRRRRIAACMADLHVEDMDWNTFRSDQPAGRSDPCARQRWHPTATCP